MLNAGTLESVLNTLKILHDQGIWLEMTNLIDPGWTTTWICLKKFAIGQLEMGSKITHFI
jgi:pyruvate formate lyase activating enzyme